MSVFFTLTDSAMAQIASILTQKPAGNFFKVSVKGGGCSGFQYEFNITDQIDKDDHQIKSGDYIVLVDDMSVPFLKNGVLDYVNDLVGSEFKIINPNAASSCGCGVSFSV